MYKIIMPDNYLEDWRDDIISFPFSLTVSWKRLMTRLIHLRCNNTKTGNQTK
jgi:hypothetical protein